MTRFLLAIALTIPAPSDDRQRPPEPAGQGDAPPTYNDLMSEAKKLSWDEHSQYEAQAMNLFFERNGWTRDESDLFARDLVLRVNEIPPWKNRERGEVFIGALRERYQLADDQAAQLSRHLQREEMRMVANHFFDIAPVALEAIRTRQQGKPFTPEQVARWMAVARPIAEEGRESIERVTRELAKTMTKEQRDVLARDLKAFRRRHHVVMSQMEKWQRGEWSPADWGLDKDPIQLGQRRDKPPPTPEPPAAAAPVQQAPPPDATAPRPPKPAAEPVRPIVALAETEWERYVREFLERHQCSAAQRRSAEGILKDQVARAAEWRKVAGPAIESLSKRIKETSDPAASAKLRAELDKAQAPLQSLFDELKQRLDALLTAEQRSRAGK